MMKNMRSCKTMSSSGIRFGLPSAATLTAHLRLLRLDAAGRRGRGGTAVRRRGGIAWLLGVVVHLRQEVVGDVLRVHADAGEAVAEQGVAEDGRDREGHADER